MSKSRYAGLCGAARDRVDLASESKDWVRRTRLVGASDVFQPPFRIHEQGNPDCMGQSTALAIEQQIREPVSGLTIWRYARHFDGLANDLSAGTTPAMAFKALEQLGWCPWHPGEDSSRAEARTESSPADDMAGYRNRQAGKLRKYRINGEPDDRLSKVREALHEGFGVVICSGLHDAFFDLGRNEVATEKHIGGVANGHAQCIIGVVNGKGVVANSWGPKFAGYTFDGKLYGGCYTMTAQALWCCWDIYAFKVAA